MKKFIRYLRLERQRTYDHEEPGKRKQRYELDYTLEPFAGLTPEYMEMSECGVLAGSQAAPGLVAQPALGDGGAPCSPACRAGAQQTPRREPFAAAMSLGRQVPRGDL